MAKNTPVKPLPHSRVSFVFLVRAGAYRRAFEEELEEVSKSVTLPGFRPGKAPRQQVLASVGRQRIEAGALDRALPESYRAAIEEAGLHPVAPPELKMESYVPPLEGSDAEREVARFQAEVDVLPEIKVAGYQKVKVKAPKTEPVTEEELERVITYLRKQQAQIKDAEPDASVAEGMWVDIGYQGSVDGVARSDMTNPHHPLIVGEGQLIPGFEENLTGLRKGEEKTFSITFPKDYHAKELAGKKAQFSVTVHELRQLTLPEKDAAFAKQFGHDSWTELEKAIRQDLEKEKAEQRRTQIEQDIIGALLKLVRFEVPRSLVEEERERMYQEARARLSKAQVEWSQYLAQTNQTDEKVKQELEEQAERNVRTGLILREIVKTEGLPEEEGSFRTVMDRLVERSTK
jgi:trigger factor